jgi:hypothetical protein
MSRSDIPITCLIRYKAVASRLQLSHCCCPDTTSRAACLCDCPICVTVTVIRFAKLTFHTNRVCTVQPVMGPRLTSLTRDNMARRAAIATSPAKASTHISLVLSPCSRRYRQHKLRFKTHHTTLLSQPLEDARQPPTPTHSSCVDMAHTCPSWRGGGAHYLVNTHT